ncbi:MAG: porin family protein [Alphaproteobacteria bacterium]|jgi:opacity protein-like surface antigen|nr:porin family protein [Alphaproteobacteria bacterium]NBY35758.1 porin family protein [Alphaproteobacteria bacterium]
MKNKCKKKIILLLLASASAGQFGLPVPVSLAQEQFSAAELLPYFRIDFGQAHFFPVKGSPKAVGNKKLHSTTNSVVSAGLGLGINFGDKFRSDITWVRHLDPVLKATKDGDIVKRKPLIDAYFLNLYYEIASNVSIFNPYIGAGVGLARVRDNLSLSLIENNNLSRSSQKISAKNNFAYKFVIGSSFDLNENVKFDLAYNYHDYGKTKSALDSRKNQIGKTHYRAHVVSAGLRFGM